MANSRLEEIRSLRLVKLAKLKSLGIDPYPPKYSQASLPIANARDNRHHPVSVSGRLWKIREHGQVVFADLRDSSGQIQLLFQEKNHPEKFSLLKLFDVGDFLGVTGSIMTTAAGETTIDVSSFELLSKSLRPLPDDWYGLTDEETRYRQRYVDLLLNDKLHDLFRRKALFWQSLRQFMIDKGFLEVETPVLENIAGGADANPFVTHHNALDIDLYLRISMGELWQKRLMVAGFDKTFEIGRQFRNEGISREHLQDYTQMEFYWAYANYEDSMALVEEMYRHIAQSAFGTLQFHIGNFDIDLQPSWPKIDYSQTLLDHTGVDISSCSDSEMKAKLSSLHLQFNPVDDRGRLIDLLWKFVRKNVAGPAFLINHPVEVSPLAKRMPDRPNFVQRFQVILAGSEMGNGYSELNDPIDQAQRFTHQQELRDSGDTEAQMYDTDFVRALEYAMPPVSGFGVSERLFSFLADKPVRESVLFPLLRPESPQTVITSSSQTNNDFSISSEVKSKFPGMSYACVVIKNVIVSATHPQLEALKLATTAAKRSLTTEDLNTIAPIAAYRQIFKSTGVDYHSRHPSPEALLRRIIQGKDLYTVNTGVDAYNLAVLETGFGLGGFDYDNIVLPVSLRFTVSGEEMHLLGDDHASLVDAGELVYTDAEKLITLDLNYRDIDQTKITHTTKNILLFADGGPGLGPQDVLAALKLGAEYIHTFCGGTIGQFMLIG